MFSIQNRDSVISPWWRDNVIAPKIDRDLTTSVRNVIRTDSGDHGRAVDARQKWPVITESYSNVSGDTCGTDSCALKIIQVDCQSDLRC